MKKISQQIKLSSIFALVALSLILSGCGSSPKYQRGKTSVNKQAVINTAKKMLGVKYRYGGTSPSRGFDCSGLVQYSHKSAGINLPRTTGQQYKASKRVSRRYLKAGDLVFFKIAVSRAVSHAPSSGKRVKISSMTEKYWRKRFTGAGRFL